MSRGCEGLSDLLALIIRIVKSKTPFITEVFHANSKLIPRKEYSLVFNLNGLDLVLSNINCRSG